MLSVAVLGAVLAGPAHGALVNRLVHHPAPYLALHADDPVAWQPWGSEAVALARDEGRLIFVSSGYFSCHWCHVMQRESYRNAEIAALLNRSFIPVKVDRELLPELDAVLLAFVQRTIGYSGWPLNVFLTPEGYPLAGLVYAPPERFLEILTRLASEWSASPETLARGARNDYRIHSTSGPAPRRLSVPIDGSHYSQAFRRQAMDLADTMSGGFGQQSKFPSVPQLRALLESQRVDPDPELGAFLELTLYGMATQGLRDQLGGGFFRYTVDPGWQTPHYEKMLYDNALLAELYLDAAAVLRQPNMANVGLSTLDFIASGMSIDDGGMIASLSAVDSAGVEGGYYLWDEQTLARLLTDDERTVVAAAWGLGGQTGEATGALPVQVTDSAELAARLSWERARVHQLHSAAAAKLLQARRERSLPVDDKRIAGWNGLALAAFLKGGSAYRMEAQRVRDFLVGALWDGEALLRARSGRGPMGPASLEDYAYVARGLLAWADATGARSDYELARNVAEQGWQRFHTVQGWIQGEAMPVPLSIAEAIIADGPLPSPSATLIEVSMTLSQRLGDPRLYSRALTALLVDTPALLDSPFFYATHVSLLARFGAARSP